MAAPTILTGDCLDVLATLPADTFQACVTSPPYYGLRDYGVDGQIGLEESPDAYVAKMVEVFRAVRRVLRPDGTVFLNLGDSYYQNGISGPQVKTGARASRIFTAAGTGARARRADACDRLGTEPEGSPARGCLCGSLCGACRAKPKDLLGIPWMVAFALRADGWFLRSAIVWAKPNPMPESVRDRPTSSYEMVFLLSKAASYFYDQDAIREPHTSDPEGLNDPSLRKAIASDAGSQFVEGGLRRPPSRPANYFGHELGRNARNVWTIATQPYSGAHFATMPPALAERCIKAGSSEKGQCPHCGAPWARQVDVESRPNWQGGEGQKHDGKHYRPNPGGGVGNDARPRIDRGWSPSCDCPPHTPTPQHVLDPFGGAGTVGLVASRLQRRATLIELNPAYAEMARARCRADAPLLAEASE